MLPWGFDAWSGGIWGYEPILLFQRAALIDLLSSVFVFLLCHFNFPGFWLLRFTFLVRRFVWDENRYQYFRVNCVRKWCVCYGGYLFRPIQQRVDWL